MKYDFTKMAKTAEPTMYDHLYAVMTDIFVVEDVQDLEDFIFADLAADYRSTVLDELGKDLLTSEQIERLDQFMHGALENIGEEMNAFIRDPQTNKVDETKMQQALDRLQELMPAVCASFAEIAEAVRDRPIYRAECKHAL